MPRAIDRDGVIALRAHGAPLVEVLPEAAYAPEHLPGAINLPLTELDEETARRLRKDRPVITYCHDNQ
jgi:rhodanese-related sulfurtransferase